MLKGKAVSCKMTTVKDYSITSPNSEQDYEANMARVRAKYGYVLDGLDQELFDMISTIDTDNLPANSAISEDMGAIVLPLNEDEEIILTPVWQARLWKKVTKAEALAHVSREN